MAQRRREKSSESPDSGESELNVESDFVASVFESVRASSHINCSKSSGNGAGAARIIKTPQDWLADFDAHGDEIEANLRDV
jgi:hypothetical protein